jgi:hypothetical protein
LPLVSVRIKNQRNAPSHRSFLDARGQADLDSIIVTEGDAHSSSKTEPQPPRYTICRLLNRRKRGFRPLVAMNADGKVAPIPRLAGGSVQLLGSISPYRRITEVFLATR